VVQNAFASGMSENDSVVHDIQNLLKQLVANTSVISKELVEIRGVLTRTGN
jgi:hypothetical protein